MDHEQAEAGRGTRRRGWPWWRGRVVDAVILLAALAVLFALANVVPWAFGSAYHRWVGPTPDWWRAVSSTLWLVAGGLLIWTDWRDRKRRKNQTPNPPGTVHRAEASEEDSSQA